MTLVRATLDGDGAPVTVSYVVQTILPDLPNVPSVDVPELPAIEVPDVTGGGDAPTVDSPVGGGDDTTGGGSGAGDDSTDGPRSIDGDLYTYGDGAAPQMKAVDSGAARAFDPGRFAASTGSADSRSRSGLGGGGGVAGTYDGASVPVFGELAGVDGASLDDQGEDIASGSPVPALPASALAAVIALATVTAGLVRSHSAQRTSRR